MSSLVHHFKAMGELVNANWSYSPERHDSGKIRWFFLPVWLWNFTDDLEKQYGTSSMLLQALCIVSEPLVKSNLSYGPETLNSGQNLHFLFRVTLKFYRWPWKTIGHLFYANQSFMHCFKAIGEFKLELQSGNAQFGSKSAFFSAWPWNLTDDFEKQ